MSSASLVALALDNQKCTQKGLAAIMKVSPAQITKWKSGEYLSAEMENRLIELAGIGDRDPDVVFWTGGIEQSDKWVELIRYLAEMAEMESETGYRSPPLENEASYLTWYTLYALREAGAEIPKVFPVPDFFDTESDDEDFDVFSSDDMYSEIIANMFAAYVDIYGFCAAYIFEILHREEMISELDPTEFHRNLFSLALAKSGEANELMPNFLSFRFGVLRNYTNWIQIIKQTAFKNNIPLKFELMNLVLNDHESIGVDAEREALGLNENMIHPDVYMNEILESHRMIHKVLPEICKRLGVHFKEDDFS